MNNSHDNFENTCNEYQLAANLPYCPVILILDTSASMWKGGALADMKRSLIGFYQMLYMESMVQSRIEIAAVSMGDNLCMLEEFTPFLSSRLPDIAIRPKGYTPIGGALRLALDRLQKKLNDYREQHVSIATPQIIMLSDGKSSDDITEVADEILQMVKSGSLIFRTIALGNDPDTVALKSFGGTVLYPPQDAMQEAFKKMGRDVSQVYEAEVEFVNQAKTQKMTAAVNAKKLYLIDGTNVIHWDSFRNGCTLKNLLTITEYFERCGMEHQVYFDASTPHRLRKTSAQEAVRYDKLLKQHSHRFRQVPAGTQADAFLLALADHNPAAVILSNDLYRDYQTHYPWLKTEKRVFSGMKLDKMIYFPGISLNIPVSDPEKEA